MINKLLLCGGDTSQVYVDISFEDSTVGSRNMFDKVSGRNLSTRMSTNTNTTDSSVINHSVHGKVMNVSSGRMWWFDSLPLSSEGLVIEMDFLVHNFNNVHQSQGDAPALSTGGLNSAGPRFHGYAQHLIRRGMRISLYNDTTNSGTTSIGPPNNNTFYTYYIEHVRNSAGALMVYFGIRDTSFRAGPYNAMQRNDALFLFGKPPNRVLYPSFHNSVLGLLRSVRLYKE